MPRIPAYRPLLESPFGPQGEEQETVHKPAKPQPEPHSFVIVVVLAPLPHPTQESTFIRAVVVGPPPHLGKLLQHLTDRIPKRKKGQH
ncbi:MAG: hypothetical protein ACUVSW_06660, partial [Roseiflexus sp.]